MPEIKAVANNYANREKFRGRVKPRSNIDDQERERLLKWFEEEDLKRRQETDPNYQRCIPNCPNCHGLGWVKHDVPVGHKDFGQVFPCRNAPLSSTVYSESGLTLNERGYTWKQLQARDDKKAQESLKVAAHTIKDVLAAKRGIVTLYGGNGLAKSLLLKIAIAETLRTRPGAMPRYILMSEIMEDLRRSFDAERPGASLKEMTDTYKRYPVLAIDELGVERDTAFTEEQRFILIDHRYNAAIENDEPLITLLATNLPLNEFPPRIYDRLRDGRCHVVQMVGESLRPGLK